ncbi:MAG TPA: hypothetical protein VHI71_03230 [Actinomycetota bacterium]|nr:hypothetical protein [Actinomycetota bacterium]
MKGRKLFATVLALGVVVGSFGVAEAAKKKKKPKPPAPAPVQVDQKFYLRRDGCNTDADNARLSLEDGVDEGNLCGWLESGLINEVLIESGAEAPVSDPWTMADGLPLTLDASKPIKGSINVRSSFLNAAPDNGLAAGLATLQVDLVGMSGGEEVAIGTASVDYEVTPAASAYTVDFEIAPEAALDKKVFEAVTLVTTIRGPAAGHGLYELDDPASTVTFPTWKVQ